MKISIITTTYNSAQTVADTLQSVANQTYHDIEHIIIDGASKDNTLEIVKQFSHVSKVTSEPDKGIYDAMNKGIALATGDIIGILNSDDFYNDKEVLIKVASFFLCNSVQTLYADLEFVESQDTQRVVRTWKAGNYTKNRFLTGFMPPHPTFFVKKEIYEKFGVFDATFKISADYEIMLRFLFKNNISCGYLPSTIIKMRLGGVSTANFKNRLIAHQEDKKAWQKEIDMMLHNGFKLEVESLMSKDISYVTDEYAPARLKEKDWLD